ncbi:MAG: hypothetical protein SGBAC_005805 [Bacillariaceae sp.]
MVSAMKLFRRKKSKESTSKETNEPSVVKVTESASTEDSSTAQSVGKDIMEELLEQGYDPETGGRLLLLESISYETGDGDRYAMTKSYIHSAHQEEDERDDDSSEEDTEASSRDVGNSESRDSTFYTVDTSPRRPIKGHDSNCSENELQTSWSLKSAGSIAGDNIYHSGIKGPLPSNSSVPDFLKNRVKSTPQDVTGPADPPGQLLDKYRQINATKLKEVSVLSMNRIDAATNGDEISECAASSSVQDGSSENGTSVGTMSALSASESGDYSSGDSSSGAGSRISDDKSRNSNSIRPFWFRPAAAFRSRYRKEPISEEESPETQEFNKYRKDMAFQAAPSFVTGAFVSFFDGSTNSQSQEGGAVECMIVPKPMVSNLPYEPEKNLPPTPTKKDDEEQGARGGRARGEYFKTMQDDWNSKATADVRTEVPCPPKCGPEVKSTMSMENTILKQAMSMGSLDVVPVPSNSPKPFLRSKKNPKQEKLTAVAVKAEKSQFKTNAKKEKAIDIDFKTTKKEKAVEVVIEPRLSKFSKLKSQMKKKANYFEGVLEDGDVTCEPELPVLRTEEPMKEKELMDPRLQPIEEKESEQSPSPPCPPEAKSDPIAKEPAAVLKRVRAIEQPPSTIIPVSRNDIFVQPSTSAPSCDAPQENDMIHPDLGNDTLEEERMADEIVGFVRLMPVALLSFFKENPDEDELIRTLQPTGRSNVVERRSSLSRMPESNSGSGLGSQVTYSFTSKEFESTSAEESQKHRHCMATTSSFVDSSLEEEISGDEEVVSDRPEKRSGGILRKLIKKKKKGKKGSKEALSTSQSRAPRMEQEPQEPQEAQEAQEVHEAQVAIEEMAAKEIMEKIEEGVEMIAGITKQGQRAIVISNTKRHPNPESNPEAVFHA